MIDLPRKTQQTGAKASMDCAAFDKKKMDEYTAQANAAWGATPEYREYEQRSKGRSQAESAELQAQMMQIFAAFGAIKSESPASEKARQLVKELQDFITAHFYTCSDQVLSGLGRLYAGGGEMTANIDSYGGEGTAAFAGKAIQAFCSK